MICSRLTRLILLLTASMCLLSGTASASTRGYDAFGNPFSGLMILLGLLFAFALFCYAYLLLDRLEQRRVDRMKRDNDIDGLVKVLRSSWLGPKAARALGSTGDERAVDPLLGALGDRREYIRKSAAEALGNLGDERALVPLSAALGDNYAGVRDCARRALERIEKRKRQSADIA